MHTYLLFFFFFFFNDTATTEIYTLSLHDALPISRGSPGARFPPPPRAACRASSPRRARRSRPSRTGTANGFSSARRNRSTPRSRGREEKNRAAPAAMPKTESIILESGSSNPKKKEDR